MEVKKKLKAGDNLKLKGGEKVTIIGTHNRIYTIMRKNGQKRCVGLDDLTIIPISPPEKSWSKKNWY